MTRTSPTHFVPLLDRLTALRASCRRLEIRLQDLGAIEQRPELATILAQMQRANHAFVLIERTLHFSGVALPPPSAGEDTPKADDPTFSPDASPQRLAAALRREARVLQAECESCAQLAHTVGNHAIAQLCLRWSREWIAFEAHLTTAIPQPGDPVPTLA